MAGLSSGKFAGSADAVVMPIRPFLRNVEPFGPLNGFAVCVVGLGVVAILEVGIVVFAVVAARCIFPRSVRRPAELAFGVAGMPTCYPVNRKVPPPWLTQPFQSHYRNEV